jgi:hypothetical protein
VLPCRAEVADKFVLAIADDDPDILRQYFSDTVEYAWAADAGEVWSATLIDHGSMAAGTSSGKAGAAHAAAVWYKPGRSPPPS